MQQQAKIEIVEYDPKYATSEELSKIVYKNYKQHANTANFTGVYHSMKWYYGTHMTHLIYLFFSLISGAVSFAILNFFLSFAIAVLISLSSGAGLCYFIFAQYLPRKADRMHSYYGKVLLLPKLSDIKGNFHDKEGNIWLALVENVSTGNKEIVGHVAFRRETTGELKARGANENEKTGQLEMMGVNEEYRGIGLARKLVQTVLDSAERKKFTVVALGAAGANYPAIELYKKFGFKTTKEMAVERWTGWKIIAMEKKLA